MKKLFIYGVTALAMLTGCNDLLDKSPLDTFTNTPAYWSNTDNLDNQCNTFYNNFTGFGNGASGGWFYFKTISDDQVDAESHNWTYTNVVASSTNWSAPFTEIRRANYIIAGVQSSSLDEATKAHYEGLGTHEPCVGILSVGPYVRRCSMDRQSYRPSRQRSPLRTTHRPG